MAVKLGEAFIKLVADTAGAVSSVIKAGSTISTSLGKATAVGITNFSKLGTAATAAGAMMTKSFGRMAAQQMAFNQRLGQMAAKHKLTMQQMSEKNNLRQSFKGGGGGGFGKGAMKAMGLGFLAGGGAGLGLMAIKIAIDYNPISLAYKAIKGMISMLASAFMALAKLVVSAFTTAFGAIKSLVSGAWGIMQSVFGMIASKVSELKDRGFEVNALLEQQTIVFEQLTGSASRAKQMIAEMYDFAARTPFEFPDLTQAAVGLLATKKILAADILPTIKKLGDAAAGSSKGFAAMPRITLAVSQMLTKGKIQAEEMNQLAEAGVPAWDTLAKAMKKSTTEVMELGRKGKLGTKEVMMLIDGLGKKYEGLMEKQSKTWTGLTSTIKDQMGMAAATAIKPFFDFAKTQLAGFVDLMNSKPFNKFVDNIRQGVAAVTNLLSSVATAARGMAIQLVAAFNSPEAKFLRDGLASINALTIEIGKNLYDAFVKPAGQTQWLRDIFKDDRVKAFVASFVGGIKAMMDNISLFTTNWAMTWNLAGNYVRYASFRMKNTFADAMNFMLAVAYGAISAMSVAFDNFFAKLKYGMSGTMAYWKGVWAEGAARSQAFAEGDFSNMDARGVAARQETEKEFARNKPPAAIGSAISEAFKNAFNTVRRSGEVGSDRRNKTENAFQKYFTDMRAKMNAERKEVRQDRRGGITGIFGSALSTAFSDTLGTFSSLIPEGMQKAFANAPGGVRDFMERLLADPADAGKAKKQKNDIVKTEDVSKRIQEALGKNEVANRDKKKVELLGKVREGVDNVGKAVGAVAGAIGKIVPGFAP